MDIRTKFKELTAMMSVLAMGQAVRMAVVTLTILMTSATMWAEQPQKVLDKCIGGRNCIHVEGWAYDPDASEASIDVHVYVYTDATCQNSYGEIHVLTANVSRPDVNEAKQITGDHGFEADIPIADAGTYWVKLFAIDSNGNGNPQIGTTTQVAVTDLTTINSTEDWDAFANNVSNGITYEGKIIKLTANISITTTVGTSEHPFMGTFDGNDHALIADITDTDNPGTAPFRYISGATIQNLIVAGTINGSPYHAAAIVGFSTGTGNSIKQCTVYATVDGSSHVGGILGHGLSSDISIEGCLFQGLLTGGSNAKGVFFGWGDDGGTKSVTNCLYLMQDGQDNSNLDCVRMNRGSVTVTNCYKTTAAGSYGTQIFTELPENEICQQMELANDSYYVPCVISGLEAYYLCPSSPITLNYTITTADGTELTKDTHYTETVSSATIQAPGYYTLTITGTGGFTGTKTIGFTVLDISSMPEGMQVDADFTYPDEGFFYVEMPKTGTKTLTFANDDITTFKVYDNGGKNGNYSNNCNGYLVLTAPEGYIIQLSGTLYTEMAHTTHYDPIINDYLTVYDNSEASGTKLIDKACNEPQYDWDTVISTVFSSGRNMTLYFHSNENISKYGLDLTVMLINPAKNITVNTAIGGSIESDKVSASEGETVTLTVSDIADGYQLAYFSVISSSGSHVHVNHDGFMSKTATFQMPKGAVAITPVFTNTCTADDGLFLNMPATGTQAISIPEGVASFMVYDDGGRDGCYSHDCNGYLVLTAPEGHILRLSGSVATHNCDRLTVWDGTDTSDSGTKLINEATSNGTTDGIDINTVTTSGPSMTLHFHLNEGSINSAWDEEYYYSSYYNGLNLTVTVIETNKEYAITVNTATGGTVESDKPKSAYNGNVTLTATPETNYLLCDLSVVGYDDNVNMTLTDMLWYMDGGTATFQMPNSDVTVTPTFTDDWTAEGGLYINMPQKGTIAVTIPESITSFKVYDNGGRLGDYSKTCNGILALTAPEGYLLQLTGTVQMMDYYAMLTVYDNSEASGTKLINNLSERKRNISVLSTGPGMTLHFISKSFNVSAGMDLTVTLVKSDIDYNVVLNNPATGCSVGSDKPSYKVFETATLTAMAENGYMLTDLRVVRNDRGTNMAVTDMRWYTGNNTATFQMPNSDVTVTPTFTNNWTAEGGLYINMFANQYRHITIPKGVQSFKVYDDGGKSGGYTPRSVSNLELHAPEGCVLRLSGTFLGFDGPGPAILNVYNSDGTLLIKDRRSQYLDHPSAIPTVTSSGQNMRINFDAGDNVSFQGLDLTMEVIPVYNYSLADNADNSEAVRLAVEDAEEHDVCLSGRTLYCDGSWNTLCLPFSINDLADTPLANATIMELDTESSPDGHLTGFSDGTLYLNFKKATSIKAGIPYIVKSDGVEAVIPYYRVFNSHPKTGSLFSPLLDGSTATDWFKYAEINTYKWIIKFEILDPVIVTGYTLTSGNTIEQLPEFRPMAWDIKASMQYDSWSMVNETIIDSRNATKNAEDATPATNRTPKTYSIAPEKQRYCRYFELSGPRNVMLAELELHGKKDYLKEPVFKGVTLTSIAPTAVTSRDGKVSFVGTYSPVSISGEDRRKLYLGDQNKLYYPSAAMTIGSCKAYFQLRGITVGDPNSEVRTFKLNFEGNGEETGIKGIADTTTGTSASEASGSAWYSLDGRRLQGKPGARGVYINNGRKVVIKMP